MTGPSSSPRGGRQALPVGLHLLIAGAAVLSSVVLVLASGLSAPRLAVVLVTVLVAAAATGAWATRFERGIHTWVDEVIAALRERPEPGRRLADASSALFDRLSRSAESEARADEANRHLKRARGLLFAAVSHDLKGPLNAVLGFSDLLAAAELTDDQRESVKVIGSRGRELVALVETVLDSARVASGQLRMTLHTGDLAKVVIDACRRAEELALVTGAFEIGTRDEMPLRSISARHLTRAFAVILAHALKSRSAGQNEGANAPIRVKPYFMTTRYRVDVFHPETAISVGSLATLFEGQRRTGARGAELGLPLARAVIELHGGRVEVGQADDGATRVSVFLPRDQPKREP